ncbi:gonadotropin-releasing hormone II receptor-like isoform X1 [Brienomyrus brachyistius]|uniref:gonadotropin-releasing hormone II receptor-like isoform X1 n=1 Tax=Brienomyrus brachyistius TaxID=42636 RepID=UPI0020B2C14D|nr:gonadotropin-releasing hormone II receptor-like isoform X1 [Brienomyrus brachyistius]XP_048886485.1 gonadotropin-releasing hormone II receptor-like isoform X1 [Brienomyrus brachyistius]XP_048886486.1 gonadotropin-releasing hormone II receptor-like isoform X1 [Brienomyrus brachyistius]XP_048886487.1 gonadotropin-releasing hormone II receptor-like isoform X1 [Brienomyrus brachyistius]
MNGTFVAPEIVSEKTEFELNLSSGVPAPSFNRSTDEDVLRLPTFSTAAKVRVIITFILCAISAACNVAVLWAASVNKQRKSHVRTLIVNLTAADLLVTLIVMPLDAIWNITVQWLAGDTACRMLMFLKLLAMYSSAFVTVVISLDRQTAILNPLAINKARRKSRVMLTLAWLMSVLLSAPQMFLFHNVTITVPQNFTQCTTRGSFSRHWQETLYNMCTFVCLFLLPLAIMIFCYTRILMEISKRMTKGYLSSKEVHLRRSKNNIPKARMRTLKMSIAIVTSFIICWTPYYLLGLWYWFSPDGLEEAVSHSLTHMLFIFGLFNACLDPITYGLFSIHFHRGLRRYRHRGSVLADSENLTATTSFRCSTSSFPLRRLAAQDGPGAGAQQPQQGRKTCQCNSYLTTCYSSEKETSQFSPDNMI